MVYDECHDRNTNINNVKMRSEINLHQGDCMEAMAKMPDNHFDLAIVDPPYGIGVDGQKESKNGKKGDRKKHDFKGWDSSAPTKEYFDELHRVSKDCIIWGANYFLHALTENHKGWVVWDKGQHGLTMSDCELAYSTFDVPTRVYIKNRVAIQVDGSIHPTQKPIKLYEWLLTNYAKEGDKILDTHLGSMSIAIACHNLKFDLDGWELDEDYYEAGVKRFEQHKRQLQLF